MPNTLDTYLVIKVKILLKKKQKFIKLKKNRYDSFSRFSRFSTPSSPLLLFWFSLYKRAQRTYMIYTYVYRGQRCTMNPLLRTRMHQKNLIKPPGGLCAGRTASSGLCPERVFCLLLSVFHSCLVLSHRQRLGLFHSTNGRVSSTNPIIYNDSSFQPSVTTTSNHLSPQLTLHWQTPGEY